MFLRRAALSISGAAGIAAVWTHHRRSQCDGASVACLKPTFIADAAEKAAPALVNIKVHDRSPYRESSGSGFIIDSKGLVLTNNHVVSGARLGDNVVTVTLSDGKTTLKGVVQHSDATSDIAVVRVQPQAPLPTVPLGTSADLRPGEFVVALGAPAGLSNSVSAGIVSAVHRQRRELGLRERRGARSSAAHEMDYIQTDAAINSGNSGGPLLNLSGEVIGINTMKVMGMDGIAFAVPVDEVKRVLAQLQQHGRVLRPYLGLKLVELNPSLADELNRANEGRQARGGGGGDAAAAVPPHGLYVMHVQPGSPAQRGGVRIGDTIVGGGAEGGAVSSTRQLIEMLSGSIGKQTPLRLLRDGREASVSVVVESMQS